MGNTTGICDVDQMTCGQPLGGKHGARTFLATGQTPRPSLVTFQFLQAEKSNRYAHPW